MPTPTDFAAFHFDQRSNDGSYQQHGDSFAAEFTQVRPDLYVSPEEAEPRFTPASPETLELSQDKENDPLALDTEKTAGESPFLELQRLLMTSGYTLGSPICHSFKSAPQQSETDQDTPYPGKR